MRTRLPGWRRRRNALRRRSDVIEAWTVMTVAFLLFVGAPLAGVTVGWRVYDGAQTRAAAQRAERHQVRAVIVAAPAAVPLQGGPQPPYRVKVRWTEPGKGARIGEARVPAGKRRGERADIWLDSHGRSVGPPVNHTAIWQHTLTTGVFTVGGSAAAVLGAHFAVRRVTARRRLAEWERDWARTGPQWTRHTA
ncbi:Rv1733c family protein [Streptomyces sp. SD15]